MNLFKFNNKSKSRPLSDFKNMFENKEIKIEFYFKHPVEIREKSLMITDLFISNICYDTDGKMLSGKINALVIEKNK